MLNKKDKNGYCNCPDCRSDNCPAADTDNCVQSVTDAKAEAVRNTLTRLWSLLSTHRTMWDAAKGNMAVLPSYAQCGLIMDDLQRCCDLLAKEPAPPLSQYEERMEMAKAMDVDNNPTATTHVTSILRQFDEQHLQSLAELNHEIDEWCRKQKAV